jgi:prevent-host-death family protein
MLLTMTRAIDLEKDQPELADLVEQTRDGDEVVIFRGNRPVAKLVSLPLPASRRFGSAKDLIELGEDFDEPLEDFRELMP